MSAFSQIRHVFFAVGSNQSPSNFKLSPLSSTSVLASWRLPSAGSLQGIKLLYKIKNTEDPFTAKTIVNKSPLNARVTGLKKFTEYEFHVLAFTANGNGPLSPVQVVRTHGDGKTIPLRKLKGLTSISLVVRETGNIEVHFTPDC